MRSLTPAMLKALAGQQTDEVFIVLVTFNHASLATPLRFSSDPTVRHTLTPLVYKTVSQGFDYYFVPMSITLPTDSADSPTSAQLTFSNVGLELITLLRSMEVGSLPATVDLYIVLASDPDTIGFTVPALDMVQADWDADTVNLTLQIESMDQEPFPTGNFDPAGFPALF